VSSLETGSFAWRSLELHLLDGDDCAAALDTLLPEVRHRRQTLARVVATGRCHLAGRTALATAVANALSDFAFLELDESGLATECESGDLDQIDRAGALREAANVLLAEAEDESRSASERDIARAALARLYSYAQAVAP
jgi:hypothetical protein